MKIPSNSVGIVQTQDFNSVLPIELDSGKILPSFTLRYETYGTLNADKSNAILVVHALSGSSHAAGYYPNDTKPGWWEILIGPGKAIDTDKYFVVSSNTLGSCYGSTGPTSINPVTGKLYGADFPVITIGDMVKAQKQLTDALGIDKWHAVIGGSMGGMQVLMWGILFPLNVQRLIPLASTPATSSLVLGISYAGRQSILRDPKWKNGHYPLSNPPSNGLAVARMIAHVTYLSQASMAIKFGRKKQHEQTPWSYQIDDTEFAVESYLRYQGGQFVARFDANSYLIISRAIDYFNLYALAHDGSLQSLFASLPKTFKMLVLSYSHDWLYLPSESESIHLAAKAAGFESQYHCIESEVGHDAFLIEVENQTRYIKDFLQK